MKRHPSATSLAAALLVISAFAAPLRSAPPPAAPAPAPAAPQVPAEACGDGVVAVVVIDPAQCTPKAVEATAKALMGDLAAELVDGPLKKFAAAHDKLTKGGLVGMTIALIMGQDRMGQYRPMMVFFLKPDPANAQADNMLHKTVAEMLGRNPAGVENDLQKVGEYWRFIPHGEAPPPAGTAEQQKKVQDLLDKAGAGAVRIAFVPSDDLKKRVADAKGAPPFVVDLAAAFGDIQGGSVGIVLGEKPTGTLTLQLKDADAAKGMLAAWDKLLKGLNESVAAQPRDNVARPADRATLLVPVLDALGPKADGASVVIDLDQNKVAALGRALQPALAAAREAAVRMKTGSQERQIVMAIQLYANDRKDKLPASLEDLKDYLPDMEKALTNPRTGQKNGFVYVKPAEKMNDIANSATTPMLYEADKDGKPLDYGNVGYVDGHVEWHEKK